MPSYDVICPLNNLLNIGADSVKTFAICASQWHWDDFLPGYPRDVDDHGSSEYTIRSWIFILIETSILMQHPPAEVEVFIQPLGPNLAFLSHFYPNPLSFYPHHLPNTHPCGNLRLQSYPRESSPSPHFHHQQNLHRHVACGARWEKQPRPELPHFQLSSIQFSVRGCLYTPLEDLDFQLLSQRL